MNAYYNEHDRDAAAWLRELIKVRAIAPGDVDERDIRLVQPDDLRGYTQCHFFAGIGGWSLALRLAGWPDEAPVWTGSCPCQPFSAAGKRLGTKDARHLWPQFRRLIRKCRPTVVFGEQVESKDGRQWLAGVRADLEALAYRSAAADLCAACVSAPHRRQRLFWVADDTIIGRRQGSAIERRRISRSSSSEERLRLMHRSSVVGLVDSAREQAWFPGQSRKQRNADIERLSYAAGIELQGFTPAWNEFGDGGNDFVFCEDGKVRRIESGTFPLAHGIPARMGRLRGYGNAIVPQVAAKFIEAYASC